MLRIFAARFGRNTKFIDNIERDNEVKNCKRNNKSVINKSKLGTTISEKKRGISNYAMILI